MTYKYTEKLCTANTCMWCLSLNSILWRNELVQVILPAYLQAENLSPACFFCSVRKIYRSARDLDSDWKKLDTPHSNTSYLLASQHFKTPTQLRTWTLRRPFLVFNVNPTNSNSMFFNVVNTNQGNLLSEQSVLNVAIVLE